MVHRLGHTEDDDLIRLVAELRRANKVTFWHTPNERKISARGGARLKAKGVLRGVPDLVFIDNPPRALELKTVKGRPTKEQRAVIDTMRAHGWDALFAYGIEDARNILRRWGYIW